MPDQALPERPSLRHRIGPAGLGTVLAGLLAIAVLLLTLLAAALLGWRTAEELKHSIGQGLAQRAADSADQLDAAMFERYREVQLLARRAGATGAQGVAQRRHLLEDLQRTYPLYAWLGLADAAGRVTTAAGGVLEGADVSQQPWWSQAPSGVYVHDVHADPLLGRQLPSNGSRALRVIDLAFPYYDGTSRPAGVLGVQLHWNWVRELLGENMLVLSHAGKVLAGPDGLLEQSLPSGALAQARLQHAGYVEERWPDGRHYLVGYGRTRGYDGYPGLGWTVLVRQDADGALAGVRRLQAGVALGGMALAVLFALLGWRTARALLQPVQQAAGALRAVQQGTARAVPPLAGSFRELETLRDACNGALRHQHEQAQQLAQQQAGLQAQLDQRAAELALARERGRTVELRMRAMLEATQEAFIGLTEDGIVTDWNERAGAIFGWQRTEALGKPVEQLLQASAGLLASLGDGSVGQPVALTGWRRDGARFDAELTLARHGVDGALAYAVFVTDATESRRSEEAAAEQLSALASAQLELADKERFLRTVADHNPAAIGYVDQDEIFRFANRSYQTLLGIDPAGMIGRSMQEVLGELLYRQIGPQVTAALRGERVHFETDTERAGWQRHFMTDYIPDTDVQGEVCGFHIVALDITARKKAELQQQEASRAKSAFLANMSHEIRTPMNAVLGIGQLLERTPLSAEQQEYVRLIRASGSALLALVNDILDLSKIEAGKLTVVAAPFQLDELAEAVAAAMQSASVGKRLDLLLTQDPQLPHSLVGDLQRLRQVALNLVGNAIKFTAEGEVRVHLGSSAPGSAMDILQLVVSDSGIGMSDEQLGRLFNPFEQADTSTSRRFGGTGLGLSISRQLVQLMGGTITVSSEAGRGSEFVVSVPLQAARRPRVDGPDAGALAGLRVLLVDDHVPTLHYLEAQLRSWGCVVAAHAAAPAAAAANWEVALVDSVLLDAQGCAPYQGMCLVGLNRSLDRKSLPAEAAALAKPVLPAAMRLLLQGLRQQGAAAQAAPEAAPVVVYADVLRGARILLVEDNPTNQVVARGVLEPTGALVTVAEHGQQAVDLLRAGPGAFDLVLMDVQMPVMDGFEATRILRQQMGLRLPILAMSAGVLDTEQARCQECGMDGFIPKPVDYTQMLATIAAHLAGAPPQAAVPAAAASPELQADAGDADQQPGVFSIRKLLSVIGQGPQRQNIVSLVERVVRQSQGDLDTARARWQGGDAAGAAAALHALRGGVGSLGASHFADATLAAEQALRSADAAAVGAQFELAQQALSATLQAGAHWLQLERPAPAAAVQQGLQAAMDTLVDMLRRQDLDALEQFRQLRPQLASQRGDHAAAQLETAIEALDFGTALDVLSEEAWKAPS
ncbi:PAS domain S-box-containing protein [Duganella sp. CF458]|uniref:ATP-binding protein n=1 Tax=Duganella sp. CF458 TaxID=1884368 RepID=UPI0008E0DAB2|nr:ATP-binding protein [Duganella sp. CF458]SFG11819.1 PAS domain S-box-containing protein [Duganella sp. CF458]